MNKQNETTFMQKYIIFISILISAAIALGVSAITGDQTVWAYMIPLGIATGVAIKAGQSKASHIEQ